MTDTTHKAPERIFATGMDRDPTGRWWHDKPLTGAIEYVRADLIAAHVAAALREAVECCTAELRNTAMLMSNPPQSSAAWDARNAILALIPDGGAALDRVVAESYRNGWRFAFNQSEKTGSVPDPDYTAAIRNGEGSDAKP